MCVYVHISLVTHECLCKGRRAVCLQKASELSWKAADRFVPERGPTGGDSFLLADGMMQGHKK